MIGTTEAWSGLLEAWNRNLRRVRSPGEIDHVKVARVRRHAWGSWRRLGA